MIFETSRQARFMIPMALSLGFGIIFATVIVLILIPSLVVIVDDIGKLLRLGWTQKKQTESLVTTTSSRLG